MADQEKSSQRSLPRLNVNSKDLSKRFKKVEGATVKHARRFVFRRLDNFREVRRHIAAWILVIGVLVGATGLQFMWYQQGYRADAQVKGGTYVEAVLGPLNTLNPLYASTSAEESASKLLFSRLLRYDKDGALNYDLIDNLTISEDKKTYTMSIRPDARWHDDLYVRARDVVFTVNLVKNVATRSTITGWSGVNVKEIDARTVAFELPSVYAPFLHAVEQLPIVPEHILRDVEPSALRENAFSSDPVGSGPFSFHALQEVDLKNGRKIIHLVRNNEYFRGQANLDRVQLHIYKDSDAIKRALDVGEVNAATDVSVVDTQSIRGDRYTIEQYPVNGGVYALLNTASPSLQDVKVRQALQLSADTTKIRAKLSDDVQPLSLPFTNSQFEGADVPVVAATDTVRASQLLDEAGWKLGEGGARQKDGLPLQLSVVTTKNNDFERVLDELASQWRALGVAVTTNIVDPGDPVQNVAQDILQPRRYDVLLYRLTIGADPDVYAYWHSSQASSGFNFSNYRSAISDDALTSARSRVEPNLRRAKYMTFARQWVKDVPAIGLYQSSMQYVHTKGVDVGALNDTMLISATDRYGDVTHWSVGEGRVYRTP